MDGRSLKGANNGDYLSNHRVREHDGCRVFCCMDSEPLLMWILDELETMRRVTAGASLTRYNDGELGYAWRGFAHRLQRLDRELTRRLREVFHSLEPGLLIGVPRIMPPDDDSLPDSTPGCQRFWPSWRPFCGRLFHKNVEYASGFVSYPDRHLPNDRWCEFRSLCDSLWADRSIVLIGNPADCIEGRRGIDAIRGHASIAFQPVPPRGAWREYSDTLARLLHYPRSRLMLVATGVSGTVLAHDLHVAGFQAVDIGRLLLRLKRMEGLP